MGAALKRLFNRIFEIRSPEIELGEARFKSAGEAVSNLESDYRKILAQLGKSEEEMIAYIESRSVFNRSLEEAYRLYKMARVARSLGQS